MARRSTVAAGAAILAIVVILVVLQTGALVGVIDPGPYNRTSVTAVDANGTELATVEVMVANAPDERYVGLGDTESLGPNEGMLFVHPDEAQRSYLMRGMEFPIDIVFVAANGTVTSVHHASVPPEGTLEREMERYTGVGKFVLEVNRGWANRTGLDEGDTVRVPARYE